MVNRLPEFEKHLKEVPRSSFSEKLIRGMVARMAEKCPIPMLMHLGRALADYRKMELREEAERN